MTSTLKEFRDFLMLGNLVELAVAFVLGVAFAALVNSLVSNLVMPVIAMIIGKPDFSDLTFTINDAVFQLWGVHHGRHPVRRDRRRRLLLRGEARGRDQPSNAEGRGRGGGIGRGAPPP